MNPVVGQIWRNKKKQTLYAVSALVKCTDNDRDGVPMVVYISKDGRFVRSVEEFLQKFELVFPERNANASDMPEGLPDLFNDDSRRSGELPP